MANLTYEVVEIGLDNIQCHFDNWIFWKVYILELYNWKCDDTFQVVIFAIDKESALAVAADYLRKEGDDFRWSEDDIMEVDNPLYYVAQATKIENPRVVIDEAINFWRTDG